MTKPIFDEWALIRKNLHIAFEQRDNHAQQSMKEAIMLFEKLLVQVSCIDKFECNDLKQYEVLPLNGVERYAFIAKNPIHFASFRQLDELFDETNKKIARLRIKYK